MLISFSSALQVKDGLNKWVKLKTENGFNVRCTKREERLRVGTLRAI